MKKKIYIILIVIVSIVFLFAAAGSFIWFFKASVLEENDPYYVRLLEVIDLVVTILIGGVIVIILSIYGERKENNRKKQEVIHDSLSTLLDLFQEKLPAPNKINRISFWKKALSISKLSSSILSPLNGISSKKMSRYLSELKTTIDNYFELVQNSFYEKAKINDLLIEKEETKRLEIFSKIQGCLCAVYE